jgi:uncharacterized protein YndB with AHSA1/START domain
VNRNTDAAGIDPSPVVHGTFTIQRSYPAPPARVFFAFADAATKRRWLVEGKAPISRQQDPQRVHKAPPQW